MNILNLFKKKQPEDIVLDEVLESSPVKYRLLEEFIPAHLESVIYNYYSNETPPVEASDEKVCNVLPKDVLVDNVRIVLQRMLNTVMPSFGPYGAATIIESHPNSPMITKDGFTILENLRFEDPIQIALHRLVMDVSRKLVDTTGDGSTSALLVAVLTYEALHNLLDSDIETTPKEITRTLEKLRQVLEAVAREEFAVDYISLHPDRRKEVLKRIATISNNNDEEIGEQVANIMMSLTYNSVINVAISPVDKKGISYDFIEGYNSDYAVANALFTDNQGVRNLGKSYVVPLYEFAAPHYALVERLGRDCPQDINSIIVVADVIHQDVLGACLKNGLDKTQRVKIVPVTVDNLMNQENLDSFLDLVAYVGADLTKTSIAPSQEHLDEHAQYELFREGVGRVLGVNMSMRKTLFVNGGGYVESSKEYLTRKADLEGALDSINKNEPLKLGRLRGRYSRLTGIHAAIYAGGHTQSEKENVKFLLEDSIAACRSVMRDGYTLGGNVTPLFALARLKDRLLAEDYEWCAKFLDPYFSQKEMKRSAELVLPLINSLIQVYATASFLAHEAAPTLSDTMRHYQSRIVAMLEGEEEIKSLICNLDEDAIEGLEDSNVIAPVNTDIEIQKSAFSIVGLLLNSNQGMTRMID